jgi:hypothetical protein
MGALLAGASERASEHHAIHGAHFGRLGRVLRRFGMKLLASYTKSAAATQSTIWGFGLRMTALMPSISDFNIYISDFKIYISD